MGKKKKKKKKKKWPFWNIQIFRHIVLGEDGKVAKILTTQKDESFPERLKLLDFVFQLLFDHFDQDTL